MSVPVIPILANYYKEILVIDVRGVNHKKYGFKDMIKTMKASHLINLFMDVSYFHDNKHLQIET